MDRGRMILDRSYRYTNFQKGELIQLSSDNRTGLVLDVNPRNVYDSESCDIFTSDGKFLIVDIKNLKRVKHS